MGETRNQPFQLRELDERLGSGATILTYENIMDQGRGKNTQLPLADLVRQSICSRLAGYEDVRGCPSGCRKT